VETDTQGPVSGRRGLPVASDWWQVEVVADDVHRLVEPHVDDLLRCNVWLLRGRDRDLLVDTGMGVAPIAPVVSTLTRRPIVCVLTHTHSDHVGGWWEFDDRRIHELEADVLHPDRFSPDLGSLISADWPLAEVEYLRSVGFTVNPLMVDAVPAEGFDFGTWSLRPGAATALLRDGATIDLGDRRFEVLHVPGHTAGSIALWEESTGVLLTGDMVYDGPLLDRLEGSDVDDYAASMRRLRNLPISVALPGHEQVLAPDDFRRIVDDYLMSRVDGGPNGR